MSSNSLSLRYFNQGICFFFRSLKDQISLLITSASKCNDPIVFRSQFKSGNTKNPPSSFPSCPLSRRITSSCSVRPSRILNTQFSRPSSRFALMYGRIESRYISGVSVTMRTTCSEYFLMCDSVQGQMRFILRSGGCWLPGAECEEARYHR